MRISRIIEQALGRSVRGEKDYCVIIITGDPLIKFLRSHSSKSFMSSQTVAQIELGLEIAEIGGGEVELGKKPNEVFTDLINKCLRREEDWKAFYAQKMDEIEISPPDEDAIDVLQTEFRAESLYKGGKIDAAVKLVQDLIDRHFSSEPSEKGWYLQEIARYRFSHSKQESQKVQLSAHNINRYLLRPPTGSVIIKLEAISQKRIERIITWVKSKVNFEELNLHISDILAKLDFGIDSERFESAINDLGAALGFMCQRPDKEWKEGPDNLWAITDSYYLLLEGKSEVETTRGEIHKTEVEQMNSHIQWFKSNYPGCSSTNIIIIPTEKQTSKSGFIEPVCAMRRHELSNLKKRVRSFFNEFGSKNIQDLSERDVNQLIEIHKLSNNSILNDFGKPTRKKLK